MNRHTDSDVTGRCVWFKLELVIGEYQKFIADAIVVVVVVVETEVTAVRRGSTGEGNSSLDAYSSIGVSLGR